MTDLRLVPPADQRPPGTLAACDDEALMLLAAGDQRAAFEVLAERHLGRVARYCAKFLGDGAAGEEVAQEALLEAWGQRLRYRSQGRFAVFLFTIARNRCRNRVRDDGRRRAAAGGLLGLARAAEEAAPAGALEALLKQERERRVRAALLDLPEKLREALLLRYDQGLEYGEIARIVSSGESTVRSRVFHGLKALRQGLGEEEP
jgi:RNA polymerase sigma-70 factor (ECF subfamily)